MGAFFNPRDYELKELDKIPSLVEVEDFFNYIVPLWLEEHPGGTLDAQALYGDYIRGCFRHIEDYVVN